MLLYIDVGDYMKDNTKKEIKTLINGFLKGSLGCLELLVGFIFSFYGTLISVFGLMIFSKYIFIQSIFYSLSYLVIWAFLYHFELDEYLIKTGILNIKNFFNKIKKLFNNKFKNNTPTKDNNNNNNNERDITNNESKKEIKIEKESPDEDFNRIVNSYFNNDDFDNDEIVDKIRNVVRRIMLLPIEKREVYYRSIIKIIDYYISEYNKFKEVKNTNKSLFESSIASLKCFVSQIISDIEIDIEYATRKNYSLERTRKNPIIY